jgi:hypothetical protein
VLILFLIPILLANATTKISNSGQFSQKSCEVLGIYQSVNAARFKQVVNSRERTSDIIAWNLDIKDVSDKDACPALGLQSIRIRGADFSGTVSNPKINYPLDVAQPKINDRVRLKIKLIQGRDVYVQRDYIEWTLSEVLAD